MKRARFGPGDVFAVPLRSGGYGLGVIARETTGRTLFGYFFGPVHEDVPGAELLPRLVAADAVLVGRFGHLGLSRGPTASNGDWITIGRIPDWDPANWPLPAFVRAEPIRGGAFLVTYDESDLLRERDVRYFPPGVVLDGPEDGLMGAGFVEIRLTRLLAASAE